MRNIRISEKQDQKMQQGEGCFKWLVVIFLGIAWFTRSEAIEVHKWPVASVGNHAAIHECDTASVCLFGWSIL